MQPERPEGVVADVPDKDGTFLMTTGNEVAVEMNPPEAQEKGTEVIALTSDFFEGHERSTGLKGPKRIVVYVKDGSGERYISSYEIIIVNPHTKPLKSVK